MGQQADIKQAEPSVADYETSAVLADRGYDANSFIDGLIDHQAEVVISSKKNRLEEQVIDGNLYQDRNKVGRYFNKLNRTAEAAVSAGFNGSDRPL